eukprot:5414090-Amphidinium_carterae.1
MERANGAYATWNNTTAFNAYQTVVRNALNLPREDWITVSTKRWNGKIVPKGHSPAHMDMPPPEQLAEFHGSNAIRLCHTNQLIEHPPVREPGSRASDDARRARHQREYEEWAVNHQDRFQSSQSQERNQSQESSERERRPERSQSYTPYYSSHWEQGAHGQWDRKSSWEERGWRYHPDYQTQRPYHANLTWRPEEGSRPQDAREQDTVQRQEASSIPPVVQPVVPPVPESDVSAPIQSAHVTHVALDVDEVLAMSISAGEAMADDSGSRGPKVQSQWICTSDW